SLEPSPIILDNFYHELFSTRLEQSIDAFEIIGACWFYIGLWHMTLQTKISPWRDRRKHLAFAIIKMRHADHWGAGLRTCAPAMASQAHVKIAINLVVS